MSGVRADLPARSPLEVSARVLSVREDAVVLSADSPGRPLTPGLVLTLLDEDAVVAVVRVDSVREGRAEGHITERRPDARVVAGLTGVAPYPIPITAVEGARAHVALPLDHGLTDGAPLQVARDGTEVGAATLSLASDEAPGAIGAAAPLRPGDVCYALASPPALPMASVSETVPADGLLVSAVDGGEVYFWAREPDAVAASTERLSIVRDEECIAVVRLSADGPLGGTVESIQARTVLTVGDQARPWAEGDSPQPAAVPEAPPQSVEVAQAGPGTPAPEAESPQPTPTEPAVVAEAPTRVSTPKDEPERARKSPPKGLSFSGPTGLIRTPSAEVQPSGVLRLGRVFVSPDLDRTFPGSRSRSHFTLGALPRMELGLAHYARFLEDLTYHAKVQLVPEGDRWPAVAVGTMDERAAFDLQPTRYLALSKHFADGRLRATLGYGHGGLDGPFGGLEAALAPELAVLAEYDTEGVNFGLRAAPTPRIHIDLVGVDGHLGGQATYAFVMDEEDAPPPLVTLPRPSSPLEAEALAGRLGKVVSGLGLENVRAEVGKGPSGPTAVVFYENRRYLHNETEALGRVLAVAAQELPPDIARLAVIATKSRVPVLRTMVNPDDYVRFLSGELTPARFADLLEVETATGSPLVRERVEGRSGLANPTGLTVDLAVTPLIRTLVGTERPTPENPSATESLAIRFSLRPDVAVNVGRGLDVRYSHGVHVAGALGRGIDEYFASDAAYAQYLFSPLKGSLARVAAGDFLGGRRGVLGEGVLGLGGDRLLVRGVAGHLSDRRFFDVRSYHWVYVGDVRYRIPSIDLVASATFGRYIDDDMGFTLGLRKYFEDTELDMQFRHSGNGDVLLLAGTVPIGPRSAWRPDPVRVRAGDRVRLGQRALLPPSGEPGSVTTASLVANLVEDFDLADTLLNRDRLNASYISSHLTDLRRAAAQVVAPAGE